MKFIATKRATKKYDKRYRRQLYWLNHRHKTTSHVSEPRLQGKELLSSNQRELPQFRNAGTLLSENPHLKRWIDNLSTHFDGQEGEGHSERVYPGLPSPEWKEHSEPISSPPPPLHSLEEVGYCAAGYSWYPQPSSPAHSGTDSSPPWTVDSDMLSELSFEDAETSTQRTTTRRRSTSTLTTPILSSYGPEDYENKD